MFAFSGRRLLLVTSGLILSAPLLRLLMLGHGVDHAAVHVLTLCRTDELCCDALVAILIQSQPYVRVARWARAGFAMPMQPVYLWLFPPERVGGWAAGLGSTASHLAGLLGYGALAIGSTMALALLSYWLFELRILRLKRYFECGRAADNI